MATITIPDAVANFINSLPAVSDYEWNEAEELLGDRREDMKAAVKHASSQLLENPSRALAFDNSLGTTSRALKGVEISPEMVELLIKTVVLAIYAADTIDETDYNTLVRPMRVAWANIPEWADLQPESDSLASA